VKPVLFSFLRDQDLETTSPSAPDWHIPLSAGIALIADLPGAAGVLAGAALCIQGYRPIPVYNASPFATYDPSSDVALSIIEVRPVAVPAVVDLLPIMSALWVTIYLTHLQSSFILSPW
jgi:hypothetical protein